MQAPIDAVFNLDKSPTQPRLYRNNKNN